MKRQLLTLAAVCLSATSLFAAHTGRVFTDNNRNGLFDPGERGMKGVAVSDGLHVVLTDAEGHFSLPGHAKERFLFITTPSGYMTFNRHYNRIETGKEQHLFGLMPYKGGIQRDGSHSFIHISDTEIFNTINHEDWTANLRDRAAQEQSAFIVHTGDICYEAGLNRHIEIMNSANMNCPVYYTIGNHDLVKGAYGEELFESLYGPVFYSFDVGNVHYIVTPMLGGDHAPSYKKEDVYHWLKNDLAVVDKQKSIVVFNHDLLTTEDHFIYGINEKEQIDLNAHNLKAWLYGHWHINYIRRQGEVLAISTASLDKGGIDHSTSAFRLLHVDKGGNLSSTLCYTYINKALRIASIQNEQAVVTAKGTIPLTVNSYSSVAATQSVTYSCRVGDRQLMSNRPLRQQTDWSWHAEIPAATLQAGDRVVVRVKAHYANGEIAETSESFRYAPGTKQQPAVEGEWNNLLGNAQHIGISTAKLTAPLQLAWIKNVGANLFMSSPLVYNNNIYVASVDENLAGEAHLYALDSRTGDLYWKYTLRNSIKNSIVAEAGLIFAQDAEGWLYAVDADNGKLRWEKKLQVNGLPALIDGLVAADGVLYAGTGKGLCAIEATSGTVRWTNSAWGQGEGTTTTLALGNNVLIAGAQWSALYANDATTGELLWKAGKAGLSDRGASAAIHGDRLYIISGKSLFLMDIHNGDILMRKELPYSVNVTSTPLVTDKEILFGTAYNGLVAVDKETMEPKWNLKTGDALIYTSPYSRKPASTIETSPLLVGNTLYIGASDGTLYGISPSDGKAIWKHHTGAPIFSTVAVSGNLLIATDFGGNVYGFISNE